MATRRTPDSARTPKSAPKSPATSTAKAPAEAKAPVTKAAGSKSTEAPATTPAVATSPAPAKRVAKPKVSKAVPPARTRVSEDTRRGMIAESAYLRAERRGFAPGHEHEDWVAAEKEVDALLNANTDAEPQ